MMATTAQAEYTESYRKLFNLNEIKGLSQKQLSNGENSSKNNHLVFLDDNPTRYSLSRSRCKRQSQSVQYLSPICLLVLGLIAIQHVPAYFRPVLSWSFNDRNNSNLDALSPSTTGLILTESSTRDDQISDRLMQNGSVDPPKVSGWAEILSGLLPSSPARDTLDEHIKNILVPRVSGSAGIVQIQNYLIDTLEDLNYDIQLDEFTDRTPVGEIKFVNIIASSDPKACRQLVLACHYDSKLMQGFVGAIDSAVPCAMLLEMARKSSDPYRASKGEDPKNRIGLTFIFFDGEEAFLSWTKTDSLYGSRHLAAKWEKHAAPSYCNLKNELKRIELFILLDLIGTSDTNFVIYNRKLRHHYNLLRKFDQEYLISNRKLTSSQARAQTAFKSRHIPLELIEDDHVPFHLRGVPVLSLLAHPFPSVWHTLDDNYESLDMGRTRRILHVLERFVSEYVIKKD